MLLNTLLSRLSPCVDEIIEDQHNRRLFAFIKYWRNSESTISTVNQLFIDFKTVQDSVMRGVLYNILRVLGTHETRQAD
jgi:hypothetical protein